MDNALRVIISGGGTGGHIFPALAIADAIRQKQPGTEVLFVGADGRMEMERVPMAGYEIKGLPVRGFDRRNLLRNIPVLYMAWKSRRMARRIVKDFRPDVAIGVGGYASGPTLSAAAAMGVPCLLQEQNSYAGVTNKLLAKSASRICVAYDGMERFFPAEKIVKTGNPVRQGLLDCSLTHAEARVRLGLDADRPTLLVVGGSLGARTLNESVMAHLDAIAASGVQVLWQTGKLYVAEMRHRIEERGGARGVTATDFIADMGAAYRAADLVVSRAGAGSISELCLVGKPAILVPSPNVAEDHQTKNARALADRKAALLVTDADAPSTLLPTALKTLADRQLLATLAANAKAMATPGAAEAIAEEAIGLATRQQ